MAIARALVHIPPLVVADEPTAHLDHIQFEGVLVLIRKLAAKGRLVLVYGIDEGEVDIYRTRTDGTEEAVAVIWAGNYFGELGPMLNLPRSASARARTKCRLTSYPLRAFRQQFHVKTGAKMFFEGTDTT